MKDYNQIWNFFASVKLAIFTICTIALTSIIGTLIPQHNSSAFYVERYGEGMARFFQVLDITEMYGSWWFLSLLGLLSANLIICSIDRFPAAWKQITKDQSGLPVSQLEKMPFASTFPDATDVSVGSIEAVLHRRGWKTQHAETDKDRVIAGQKGAWTRTGVYIVHTSILIIFAGAIVGHFLGFKGNVMIPETKKTAGIFTSETQAPFDLGFEVRCDMFEIEFYDNGMPKEYRSKLTVIENDVEVLTKEIEVNSPLKYKGITFYQSSYEGYRDFLVTLTDAENGISRTFVVPFQQQVEWPEKNIVFGIVNAEAIKDRVVRMKVWFKSADQPPVVLWLDSLAESPADKAYTIKVKQMYATGLQVAKDPGVWLVYLGCGLMMLGLFIAFFMSHQRVWVILMKDHSKRSLLLVGTTNKNKIGFEKIFSDLTADVRETCDKKTA